MQNSYISNIKKTGLNACEDAQSFLQSSMWGEFKSRFGWSAAAFLIDWTDGDKQETLPLLALCRRLAPGISFAYVPWGPELPSFFTKDAKAQATAQLAEKLKTFLARNTAFIRFEPPWTENMEQKTENKEQRTENEDQSEDSAAQEIAGRKLFLDAGFRRAAAVVQPPDTVIVDLSPSCGDILAAMKPKWRYNVSLAVKKGVIVNVCTSQELETFYTLLKETAQRDGIAVHNYNYYKTLFELCETYKGTQIRLYTASHEDDALAAIVVLFRGKDAVYLYGASSNIKRNLMAPYALQWKAMQDAKETGCRHYDLFGIPPNDDPDHPMAGLYRFKTGFGGQIVHRPGSWDYAYKPFIYFLFKTAERIRKKLMDIRKKK